MRKIVEFHLPATLAIAASLAIVPGALTAQDAPAAQQACMAEVTPSEIAAGQAAVELTANLPQQIGDVTTVEPAAESGLALASPEDLPRTELAAPEETPEPIEMSMAGSMATVWLSSENAEEGTHEIVLQGSEGSCTAEVTVTPASGGPSLDNPL